MRLELARSAGFCYGVRRAVQMAEMAAEEGRPCVMLGPIIHNRHVVEEFAAQGVRSALLAALAAMDQQMNCEEQQGKEHPV